MSAKLKCPFCGKLGSTVEDSRPGGDNTYVRRRRECINCKKRFTSHERIEQTPLRVIKKGGHRVSFNRKNIMISLIKSSAGSMSMAAIHDLCEAIVTEIHEIHDREISSSEIGRLVLEKLKKVDDVAYIRFASVFEEIETAEQFLGFLKAIK